VRTVFATDDRQQDNRTRADSSTKLPTIDDDQSCLSMSRLSSLITGQSELTVPPTSSPSMASMTNTVTVQFDTIVV
jgi:hypothetical protein